jgi:hypothetical protein
MTASATYHRAVGSRGMWASTIAWGRNIEPAGATNALLVETSFNGEGRNTWFGRLELSEKSGHDLALDTHDLFAVAKLQAGYTRYLPIRNGVQPGVGGGFSAAVLPGSLETLYGRRVNFGFAIFLTVRPGPSSGM